MSIEKVWAGAVVAVLWLCMGSDASGQSCWPAGGGENCWTNGRTIGLSFEVNRGTAEYRKGAATWNSGDGVLWWLYSPTNPEAFTKVLDFRWLNGYYALSHAALTDQASLLYAAPSELAVPYTDAWWVRTGRGRRLLANPDPVSANEIIYCAWPASRSHENICVLVGSVLFLSDAWDSQGRIPLKYRYGGSFSAATGQPVPVVTRVADEDLGEATKR